MSFFDTDRWSEIWQTIARNKKRSIMTALGIFWGIFMLIVMLGAGQGLGRMFRTVLGDMSNNTMFFLPDHLAAQLPDAAKSFLARQGERLAAAEELVGSRSPQRILRLGFAVVRSEGRAVVSAREVRPGQRLEIEVADGRFTAEVK